MNCDWAAMKWLSCSGYVEGDELSFVKGSCYFIVAGFEFKLLGHGPVVNCQTIWKQPGPSLHCLIKTKLLVLPVLQLI